MAVRGLFRKTFFPPSLVNCLRSRILLPSKTYLFLAVSKEKHYLNRYTGTLTEIFVMLISMLRSIPAKLRNSKGKTSLQVFFVHFTWPALSSVTYGTIRLPLILLTTTKIKKTLLGAHLSVAKDVLCQGVI